MVEKGSLESSENKDAYCQVEGQTTIIMIKPEGTPVKKGEIVCQLDSAALSDQLVNQKITTKSAEANHENAKLTREVAEIAVVEYEEGIFKQDFATVEGEIKLAESDLSRSEDRLDWARRMFDKGYVSKATVDLGRADAQEGPVRARAGAEQEEGPGRLHQGQDDQGAQERGREGAVGRAGQEGDLGAGRSKEKKLERQIAACDIKAPADGLVVYANDPNRAFGSSQPQIEEGATVRERQKIFSLPDITRMQVNTKVHESQIDKLAPGHEGQDPRRRVRGRDARRHGDGGGSPARLDQLLQLGHQGLHDQGQDRSASAGPQARHDRPGRDPGGPQDRRVDGAGAGGPAVPRQGPRQPGKSTTDSSQTEVELGVSNEKYVEVVKGLNEGDVVAMSPMSLMTDEEKRKAFGSASKGGKKDWGEDGGADGQGRRRASVRRALRRRLPAYRARPARRGDPAKAQSQGQGCRRFRQGQGRPRG